MGNVHTPVISPLWRLRQKDCKFEANLGNIARTYLKQTNKTLKFVAVVFEEPTRSYKTSSVLMMSRKST
jgi:hypothetical protein